MKTLLTSTTNTVTSTSYRGKCRNKVFCIQQWNDHLVPTRHVDHPAVAVLHQVTSLTVNPAGCDAVSAKEVWVHRRGLAVPPRGRQVRQLGEREEATVQNHFSYRAQCVLNALSCDSVNAVIWPYTSCQYDDRLVTLSIWKATACLLNLAQKMIPVLAPWWIHVHSGA